jgi:hypothetical protein
VTLKLKLLTGVPEQKRGRVHQFGATGNLQLRTSSTSRSRGHVSNSAAIRALRFSPPEMPLCSPPPMRESAQECKLSNAITSSTRSEHCSGVTESPMRSCAWNRRYSRTVLVSAANRHFSAYAPLLLHVSQFSLTFDALAPCACTLFRALKGCK